MIAYVLVGDGILLACDTDEGTIEKMAEDIKGVRIAEIEVTNKRLSFDMEKGRA